MAGIFIPGNTISLGAQGSGGGAYSPIGASFDAVYTQDLYSDFGVASTAAAIHSVTRASTKYVEDTSGLWTSVSANTLARSNKGVLIEESRTNSIRNNSMQGAIAPSTLPTNWAISAAAGLTTTIIGTGTESGVDYIDIRLNGTTSATSYILRFDDSIAMVSGQSWTESFFAKLVGGSLTNITATNLRVGASVGSDIGPTAFSLTSSLTRFSLAGVTTGTGNLDPRLTITFSSGVAIDITLRIGWPQLELGAFATSPIRTTNAAATRAADVITIDSKYASLAQGSAYVEWEETLGIPATIARLPFALAVDSNNRIRTAINAGTGTVVLDITSGGASQVSLASANPVAAGNVYRAALRWGNNDAAIAMTSALQSGVLTDTSCTMPTGSFAISPGLNALGTGGYLGVPLRRLTFYPRKLTDAELGALVA